MTESLRVMIRALSRPLEPVDAQCSYHLQPLHGVRAVLFDIYGTLLISASGDIDADSAMDQSAAFREAVEGLNVPLDVSGSDAVETLVSLIREQHAMRRSQGIEYPEVDIREIWRTALRRWHADGRLGCAIDDVDVERLAVAYEMRVNPVWPMPDALACLEHLRDNGYTLGVVSNAQFYTPVVVETLMDRSWLDLGFHPSLQFYSYQRGCAKPGLDLYEDAAGMLDKIGISPNETVYVGNDMLNDILPAQTVGFRGILFAGDRRSLRQREDDARTASIKPAAVVTQLSQLADVVRPT